MLEDLLSWKTKAIDSIKNTSSRENQIYRFKNHDRVNGWEKSSFKIITLFLIFSKQ